MHVKSSEAELPREVVPDDARRVRPGSSGGRVAALLWPGLAALLVCVFWTLAESTRLGVPAPFEDAAMLFRYAENLAQGWGIAWNAGQAPGLTDGATDLGFVLALAPLTMLGLSTAAAAVLLNLAAIFGIGALFGVLNEKLWHRALWVPVSIAALVGAGPVNRYVLSGFSPPVLGLLLLGAFVLAALAPLARSQRTALLLLAGAGVMAGMGGWWRPEAFALGPLVVVFGLLLTRRDGRRSVISVPAAGALLAPFAALVVGWVILRIGYFGQLLPTSALMKSGSLHVSNVVFSLQFYGSLLLPLVGVLVARMLSPGAVRRWWTAVVLLAAPLLWVNAALPLDFWGKVGVPSMPAIATVATVALFVPTVVALAVVGVRRRDGSWLFPLALVTFSLAWVAIATTLNWWGRMQWPLVPILVAIAATHALATGDRPEAVSNGRRAPIVAVALLACIGLVPFHLPIGSYFESPFQTAVAAALRSVDTSTVRIATTEAGLIPLAVTGPALDTYGHNNRHIAASHGRDLGTELDAFTPNVLAMHGLPPESVDLADCSAEQRRGQTKFSPTWSTMVTKLYGYAERRLTLTRLSETTPCETWSVWVSPELDPRVRQALEQLSMPGTEIAVDGPRPSA